MRSFALLCFTAVIFVLVACEPADDDFQVPTLAELATATEVVPTDTPAPTHTSSPTATATDRPTNTPIPSNTPTLTATAIPSTTPTALSVSDMTRAVIATSTAQIIEAPRFATFTPIPPGVIQVVARPTSTGTPEIGADIVITQSQYQEEVDRIIGDNPDIGRAQVQFVAGGIDIELTASSDTAFTTGTFSIEFVVNDGSFNNVLIARPMPPEQFRMNDGGEPSETFVDIAYGVVTPAVFEAFDFIITQRMGDDDAQRNVEDVTFDDAQMNVFLIVPQPAQ